MYFFSKLAVFNISWQQNKNKEKRIDSYIASKRGLTKSGMNKHKINHAELSSLAMQTTKNITKFQGGALKDERVLLKALCA
ncbi:hypothetical protein A9Q82_09425 [Cycloclasticus sp. 46_120_T64]|nr:hypothetical protein A9Q82_09425 [Cycloclasticus sp. 46_120_T64]